MFAAWILLCLPLLGARAFMIHNTQHSLCLEDSAATGEVQLKECSLDSDFQQWLWTNQGMLMCVASSRCLSSVQKEPVRTSSCQGPEVDAVGLMWDCDRDRLISRNTSMMLSIDGRRPILSDKSKYTKWRSVDGGDICQEKLRSRRASGDPEEFEVAEGQENKMAAMTKEEREYLRWFYRTEDPTMWRFVLLGGAFICLLIGFLLLGMGAMANKNRKKIAKYKAAAAMAQRSDGEELQVVSPLRRDSSGKVSLENKSFPSNGEVSELKAGDIVVTWKDGNTSCLYPDPAAEPETHEEKQEGEAAAEVEAEEVVMTTE